MSDDEISVIGEKLPVRIRENGDVDNETVNLRRDAGDEIVWKSLGGDFTIRFARSPFQRDTFHIAPGCREGSGPLREPSFPALGHQSRRRGV